MKSISNFVQAQRHGIRQLIRPSVTDTPCPILAPFFWRKGGKARHCIRTGSTGSGLWLPLLLLAVSLAPSTQAQVVQAANQGGLPLSAGGTVSGYQLGYGQIKILGGTAFVDVDTLHHFGVEGEFRMLTFHLKANQNVDENAKTYLAGPRYSRHYGRFQPYVKGLVGIGQFNYPYNYAKETDLVVAGGGGVDYRLTNRIRWRAADFEYQMWPQFTFGRMSSYGLSSGIRIMIR